MPSVLDRSPYNIWAGKGSSITEELVVAKVNKILETYHPAPLPEGVGDKLAEILDKAEKREKTLLNQKI
jgi:trimethylamine:corrinoid methyltransferase-like protein